MIIFVLALVGGMLTILSPCILPVIPLAFSRAGREFRYDILPMLVGLALAFTFAAVTAASALQWFLVANEAGRYLAILMLAMVGLSLVSERASSLLAQPFTRLGARLLERSAPAQSASAVAGGATVKRVLGNTVVGFAIGFLWAPCAGPILGLLIGVAATSDPARAGLLFLTFATGAAMSLAAVLSLGSRMLSRLSRAGRAQQRVRRTLGIATIATVVAILFGWDRAFFAKGGLVQTASAEELLVHKLAPGSVPQRTGLMSLDDFAAEESARVEKINLAVADGELPSLKGGTEWINSPELTPESLRGKVVLVDFWTFACYNCLNALPHVKELYAKYKDRGFVVIGVHTPELSRERVPENVRSEVKKLGITYPVVIDNNNTIWNTFQNQYWPAAYYADATGKLRFYHFGEGRYEDQDKLVAKLLAERDAVVRAGH